jgi:hypothetical protein
MKVGFTGTQIGMSDRQKEQFVLDLQDLNPTELHHGDCIGADAEAHDIVRAFFPECFIVSHPPIKTNKRAYKKADVYRASKDYLIRNKDIVNEAEVLFGAPSSDVEELRSGTWSTIRFGRKMEELGKCCVVVLSR